MEPNQKTVRTESRIKMNGSSQKDNSRQLLQRNYLMPAQKRFETTYRPSGKRPSSTYKHWLSGLLKCPACGRTLTAATMKRANGEKYSYFSCYGYHKGKCEKPHGISSLVLEKEVLACVKESLSSGNISYTLKERQPIEVSNEKKYINQSSGKSFRKRRTNQSFLP